MKSFDRRRCIKERIPERKTEQSLKLSTTFTFFTLFIDRQNDVDSSSKEPFGAPNP